ncbi:MAG TPA: DUF2867 domain-containing protein [Solirubrobacterales bacterium]|nr:DUF2867 domain-containing protein [Solirubrobacterales bacterium]
MRLPKSAHTARSWRIHELVGDLDLEDVWALPTPGGPDDFPRLVRLLSGFDPAQSSSAAVRALFAIREKVGEALGWEDAGAGTAPFRTLYLTDDEWAIETINRTVHGVLHFGWVAEGTGTYRGQMAIYVKRNGLLGTAYMTAIKPFRYKIVYPRILAELERAWRGERT